MWKIDDTLIEKFDIILLFNCKSCSFFNGISLLFYNVTLHVSYMLAPPSGLKSKTFYIAVLLNKFIQFPIFLNILLYNMNLTSFGLLNYIGIGNYDR